MDEIVKKITEKRVNSYKNQLIAYEFILEDIRELGEFEKKDEVENLIKTRIEITKKLINILE